MRTTPEDKINTYVARGWWGDATLSSLFAAALQNAPDGEALLDPSNRSDLVDGAPRRLSFREIDRLADCLAAFLHRSGLRQGDKILLQMPNVVEIVLAYLAAGRLGLIVSPVAMQYGQFELSHIDEVIAPSAYLAFRRFRGAAFGSDQGDALNPDCLRLFLDEENWQDIAAADDAAYRSYRDGLEINANDIFTICWTSGTTGRSKGVPRSYNHWLSSTLASEDAIRLKPGAVMLNPFPFINMAAIGGFLFYWLQLGAKMVLHHPFEANVLLGQLQDEKVEYTIFPPAVLTQLLHGKAQVKAHFDLSALKIVGSGSAPLEPQMITGFKSEFGVDVVNIFGSNEGMTVLSNIVDVPVAADRASFFPRFGRSEFDWDNRVSQRLETKLVDIETGAEIVTPGQVGECYIRGVTVFDGYYNSPEDNAQAFSADGYFRSGDLFEIAGDKNQFYRFVGRCKSLIVRGGVNISPEELDEILARHPSIAEVAVAAYPDTVMGEKICAFAVLHDGKTLTLDDLRAFMDGLKVAIFKWPERLEIIDALPRNAMNMADKPVAEICLPQRVPLGFHGTWANRSEF